MGIVELEPIIRIKLVIFLVGYLVLTFVFRYFMRNYLKIEKRKGFFRKHVNDRHKNVEHILTIIVIALFIGAYFYETRTANGTGRFFLNGIILVGSVIVLNIVQAFMEWKYLENRKEYILTLSELIFAITLLGIAFASNLFGLFQV